MAWAGLVFTLLLAQMALSTHGPIFLLLAAVKHSWHLELLLYYFQQVEK